MLSLGVLKKLKLFFIRISKSSCRVDNFKQLSLSALLLLINSNSAIHGELADIGGVNDSGAFI